MTVSYRVEAGGKSSLLGPTEFVIGRSLYCTMIVDDPSVSRLHASIRRSGNRCEVADLGSRNGTFVNDKKVGEEPVPVTPDDEIRVGNLVIRLVEVTESSREQARTSPHLIYAAGVDDAPTQSIVKTNCRSPNGSDEGGKGE